MNGRDEKTRLSGAESFDELEPEVREALGDFKASVNAWSEAMMSRPREVKAPARMNWSLVTKWALGCAVFAGTVSGGVYENHRQQQAAKAEAARIAEHQREMAAQRAKDDELMAKVDSDVAREVPSALEPLASLMDDSGNIGN
jgi:hypothetical protein